MNIALIAHDSKKQEMIAFVKKHEDFFKQHTLFATGTTGLRIMENTDLMIHRCLSGPYGGDQQIGACARGNRAVLRAGLDDGDLQQGGERIVGLAEVHLHILIVCGDLPDIRQAVAVPL